MKQDEIPKHRKKKSKNKKVFLIKTEKEIFLKERADKVLSIDIENAINSHKKKNGDIVSRIRMLSDYVFDLQDEFMESEKNSDNKL